MDPLTLAILTGVGGQALSQAGNLIPNSLERSQANELSLPGIPCPDSAAAATSS